MIPLDISRELFAISFHRSIEWLAKFGFYTGRCVHELDFVYAAPIHFHFAQFFVCHAYIQADVVVSLAVHLKLLPVSQLELTILFAYWSDGFYLTELAGKL